MLFWICVSAPFLFLLSALAIGFITSGYTHINTTISYLVHGDRGMLQTANFIVCGILILYLAYIFRDAAPNHIRSIYLVKIGIVTLGLSLLLLGIFPTDKAGETTLVGQAHGLFFIASVLIQAIAQILFAVKNLNHWYGYAIMISGIITAVGLPSMLMLPDWRGLIQKIFVAAIMWWVTIGSLLLR